MMNLLTIGVPTAALGGGGFYLHTKRTEYLQDPVLTRALLHLKKDYRVADFCGEQIEAGWMITREKRPGENWIKYDLHVRGTAGKLKVKVIGDYLTHQDLYELEDERKTHRDKLMQAKEELSQLEKEKKSTEDADKKITQIEADYVPVDFDAYSIIDKDIPKKGSLSDKTQIWRISSLTAQVDDDTRILVLPLPESKRQVKIADTEYKTASYEDLQEKFTESQNALMTQKEITKRFEDKTNEEI